MTTTEPPTEPYVHAPTAGPPPPPEEPPPAFAHAPTRGDQPADEPAVPMTEPQPEPEPETENLAAPEPEPEGETTPNPELDPEPEPVTAEVATTPEEVTEPRLAAAVGPPPEPSPRFVPRPVPYEPPPERRYDAGRWLRVLAGVDDRLLRQVWFERARHTALGGIILGTGLIAGLSMWTAINASFGYESLLHLVPALIWFVFIISLDRALVSTMFGAGRRWGAFLMRLALAVMFGFIIAEPLTIRIFNTAIEEHIRNERTQELADLQSNLLRCNTKEVANGTASPPAGCGNYLLSFEATPVANEAQLAALREEEAKLSATVVADGTELARLQDLQRQECAGTSGVGLTGQRGYGPECRDRGRDVDQFVATHPMQANNTRLADLRAQIATLTGDVAQAQADFEQTRDELVATRVEEVRSHQGPIGLLERMNALHALAGTSTALFLGTWAVRLFFVLADCLPVVVKFSGGTSEYDKIVRAQASGSVRRHEQEMEILRTEAEHHVRRHRSDLDLELQQLRADAALQRGEAVRKVSDHLLNPRP